MGKNKEKAPEISPSRERILFRAKESLESFFTSIQKETQKKMVRWEKKASAEREKALLERHETLKKKILEQEASIAPMGAYASDHRKEPPPPVEEVEKPQQHQDNWMRSDAHGQLLGDESEEKEFFRQPYLRGKLYGGKR